MTTLPIAEPVAEFERNVERVHSLMNFDHVVMSWVIDSVERYTDRVEAFYRRHHTDGDPEAPLHPNLQAEGLLGQLKAIRQNRSVGRPYITEINNQALVLLVSYFASATRELLRRSVKRALLIDPSEDLLETELKITVRDIAPPDLSLPDFVVDRVLELKGISFQDMQSIARSFEKYTGFRPERSRDVNNIIAGQAARHAIVHAGGTMDERFMRQLESATPRDLLDSLEADAPIELEKEEVGAVATSMQEYLRQVVAGVQAVAT